MASAGHPVNNHAGGKQAVTVVSACASAPPMVAGRPCPKANGQIMRTPMRPSPEPASSAIVERDGRFLLVRRRNPPAADLYAFPGGRGEAGETPAETALRELHEETGLQGSNPRLYAVYDLKSGGVEDGPPSHFMLSVFLVDADPVSPAMAASDAKEVGWFSLDEIHMLPAPPSVLECAERLARERQSR